MIKTDPIPIIRIAATVLKTPPSSPNENPMLQQTAQLKQRKPPVRPQVLPARTDAPTRLLQHQRQIGSTHGDSGKKTGKKG
jgi:hypothetical protein